MSLEQFCELDDKVLLKPLILNHYIFIAQTWLIRKFVNRGQLKDKDRSKEKVL